MTKGEAKNIVRALIIARAEYLSRRLGDGLPTTIKEEEWEAIAKLADVEL